MNVVGGDTEKQVAAHYGRPNLVATILETLARSGKPTDPIDPDDLAAADEFHLGWRPATVEFARAAAFASGSHVLDIGAGLGGPARYFAGKAGLRVTGIDITPDYVAAAGDLTARCGLADQVDFQVASALALPFADASFDGAYTIHVCMNIADKAQVFAEARRVLRPGTIFAVYDAMRGAVGGLPYPMPWATTAETSFVETPAVYRRLIEAAGFAIIGERDRTDLVRQIGNQMRAQAERDGVPPLGLHTLIGPGTQERLGNVQAALKDGLIAPTEIIARAV